MNWNTAGFNAESMRAQVREFQFQKVMAEVRQAVVYEASMHLAGYWFKCAWIDAVDHDRDLARWADDGGANGS